MVRIIQTFDYAHSRYVIYRADKAGDELPLHEHLDRGHLTVCMMGSIEVFFPDRSSMAGNPGDAPFEFGTGRLHGIRATMPGAMFMSVTFLPPNLD